MMTQSVTEIIASLVTLTFLEIILGVDNLVFLSIVSSRLPPKQQKLARKAGLIFALTTRLILLASALWIIGLTKPLLSFWNLNFSGRDIFLIFGGLFLLYKSTLEIHAEYVGPAAEFLSKRRKYAGFVGVVVQIGILDIVFSLDSIFTAIGMTQQFWIMATAISIAIALMIIASEPLSKLVLQMPTIKMLALSFLLLIGTVLVADGFHFHIPRQYIYFALTFSVLVESLNLLIARRRNKKNRKSVRQE